MAESIGYYFTDDMTGCAFAADAGPAPRVGHFNFVGGDSMIDDARINREIESAMGAGATTWKKADYKESAVDHVTLVGVLDGMRWAFYSQKYKHDSVKNGKPVYEITDVVRIGNAQAAI